MSDSGPCVFVDTTVLLYSEDQADPSRQRRALAWLRELWQRRTGRISTSGRLAASHARSADGRLVICA